MQLKRREKVLLAVLAAAAVAVVLLWTRHPESAPVALGRSRPAPSLEPIPRIDLARLFEPRPDVEVGRRDLFALGTATDAEDTAPVAVTPATPNPVAAVPSGADVSVIDPALSRLAPLNLKFIGSVENARGVRVAVLLTDRNEVLTGQAGQVVANRYRIARIGIESVDLEEVGSGQTRRVPLKGN